MDDRYIISNVGFLITTGIIIYIIIKSFKQTIPSVELIVISLLNLSILWLVLIENNKIKSMLKKHSTIKNILEEIEND